MTSKANFSPEEWTTVLEGPPSAGILVATAARGGTFRETFAVGKAYAEARQQHGASQLLDEIVAARPEVDHTRFQSPEELRRHSLQHLRDAIDVLQRKATPQEVEDYRRFIATLVEKVASAHREDGVAISRAEQAAIEEVATSLGTGDPQ
jgi:hypothetical protein